MSIEVIHRPDHDHLERLGVFDWPVWEKEVSTFPWRYDEREVCYILEGQVTVTPDGGGEPVTVGEGDLVTFPEGMDCTWEIHRDIRKHYRFG
ncbi:MULTISPECIES: cupin domain-containing protein [unclassified Thioalkalivibrio]|uniref:cupin domain-containing protein n=1 Tax=unclassified Thioalkalivibrio TaxID=2621013 RepID=UPI00037CE9EB|nr:MULTISPECIES: cupin domain-containing protein [unclassified Thioalkalivibrio]